MLSGARVTLFWDSQLRWSTDDLAMMPAAAYFTLFSDGEWNEDYVELGIYPVQITVIIREPAAGMRVLD